MAQSEWFKLDENFYTTPEFLRIRKHHGKAAAFDAVVLLSLLAELDGEIHLSDVGHMERLKTAFGKSEKGLRGLLGKFASCGLFKRDLYEGMDVITSDRAYRDAQSRKRRREVGRENAEKRWGSGGEDGGEADASMQTAPR